MATQGDLAPVTGQAESASATGQGDSVAISDQDGTSHHTAQNGSEAIESQDRVQPKNISVRHDCGCRDIYDGTGKKRQQACQRHKLDPNRSILSLPPKKPLSESTNMSAEQRILSVRPPQATRIEQSPPRQPPVVTPYKGRNFVQATETGPTFLDPFNSEPAIEPTGPPNSLTTIPTAKDEPVPQNSSNPPQVDEDASGSQGTQPQKLDAVEGQDPGNSKISKEEEPKAEQEKRVELGGTEEFPDTRHGDEEDSWELPTISPIAPLNSPHHRHDITPKSILKKTVGTAAEARLAEEGGMPSWEQSGRDRFSEGQDPRGGTKLFQESLAKLRANHNTRTAEEYALDHLNSMTPRGAGTPRMNIELNALSGGGEDSDGESADRVWKWCPFVHALLRFLDLI